MRDILTKTLIPLLLAIAALLSAGVPYYRGALEQKEREKGQLVAMLLQTMDCTVKVPIGGERR